MATLHFPEAVAALGRESILFLTTVVNPAAVTVAEAAAVSSIHLHCAIRAFSPNAEQAKTKKYRLCSKQGFDVLGRIDWAIERLVFIDDPQALDSASGYLHKTLVDGTRGWILRRQGLDSEFGSMAAYAAAQRYDIFPVEFGVRVPVPVAPEEEGQEFEYGQEVAMTGPRRTGTIAA